MGRYSEDPLAPSEPGYQFHEGRRVWSWWCNCSQRCSTTMREVCKATYYSHNPRTANTTTLGSDRGGLAPSGSSTTHPAPPSPQRPDIPARSPSPPPIFNDPDPRPPSPHMDHQAPIPDLNQQDNAPGSAAPLDEHGQDEALEDMDPEMRRVRIEHVQLALKFIHDINAARITDDIFPKELQASVLQPIREIFDISDPDVELSLSAYLAISNASQETYRRIHRMILKRIPGSQMLSFEQIQSKVAQFSRIVPIISDMCPNSCVAYTSEFKEAIVCPECGQPRFEERQGKMKSRQKFYTLPIAPTIQALWRNPFTAQHMGYRRRKTLENFNKYVNPLTGKIHVTELDDYTSGEQYLKAVMTGVITLDDTALMISMDGAQLYRQKQSDCWIYIWVLLDLPPELRYKKRYVVPGAVIPGPNAPKNLDSFLFPGFAHVASLQKDKLHVWDSSKDHSFQSRPIAYLPTADGPAMVNFSRFVGHKGYLNCREFCNLLGRRSTTHSKQYYPALLKPRDHDVARSSHPDVDILNHLHNHELPGVAAAQYARRLEILMAAENNAQYIRARRDTGITGPSIFSAFHVQLPIPGMFPSDVMHLFGLNIPEIILLLFRGTISCEPGDDRATWDWAVLTGDIWERHGKIIGLWRPYFAATFDHVPPDPVQYINSGYRSQEYLIYIYDLLPAILYKVMPREYWTTFCKLCAAVKLLLQQHITRHQIEQAHVLMLEFVVEYEAKFVQRKASRLHFVRPCIHNCTHIAPSTLRIGPHCIYCQYTMERSIGNLGEEIKQHSSPYANLSQRAVRRAQVNAVTALILDGPDGPAPTSPRFPMMPAGDGYTVLWPRDRRVYGAVLPGPEFDALDHFFEMEGVAFDIPRERSPIKKWARLLLPNGEVVRSRWKENQRGSSTAPIRITRMVKFLYEGLVRFGEANYFFAYQVPGAEIQYLAMISMAGLVDRETLAISSGALRRLNYTHGSDFVVVKVSCIQDIVSILPFPLMQGAKLLSDTESFVIEDFGKSLSGSLGDATRRIFEGYEDGEQLDEEIDED